MDGPSQTANKDNSVIWPELWNAFSGHRQNICELLKSVAPSTPGTLCIWGAGRTTDLDLIPLSRVFRQIDLVDLNEALTSQALVQRGFDEDMNVRVLPGVDLSGLNDHWDRLEKMPGAAKPTEIYQICSEFKLDLERYDVVASTCLMSQILRYAVARLQIAKGTQANDPSLFSILKTIRDKHIELMLEHTKPGGTALLVTDLTSQEALPKLLDRNADLNQLLNTEVLNGNHFHGVNPKAIVDSMRSPRFANTIQDIQASPPWIWDSIETQYLCLAFRCTKY